MSLFRVFLPSWQFYDRPGADPQLHARTVTGWIPILQKPPTHWYSLFFNPRGNFHHALTNLLERLLQEVQDADRVSELISYRLLEATVHEHLISQGLARPGEPFQFKITVQGIDVLLCSAGQL